MHNKKALIMVDLQNDFCVGGNLAVPGGDEIIPLANKLQSYFDLVVASKDWHPNDHLSFASNHANSQIGDVISLNNMPQVLWPDHCVQNSHGSEFHPQLQTQHINKIIYKGIDKTIDSYSAFFDNGHLRSTGLGDYLRDEEVTDVYILGLATDYCVKYTALDAVKRGFRTYVIVDGTRGVELHPGDTEQALKEMQTAGVILIKTKDVYDQTISSGKAR